MTSAEKKMVERLCRAVITASPEALAMACDMENRLKSRRPVKTIPGQSLRDKRIARVDARENHRRRVRDAVLRRATNKCEHCGRPASNFNGLEVDEMFGGSGRRWKRMTENECWALLATCHRERTANAPSREYWLALFAAHCRARGLPIPKECE